MGAEQSEAVGDLAARLVEALGPVPFVVLILAGLLIWQAPKLWRRSEAAAPPATAPAQDSARALGRVEGLIEGHAERLDAIEERLRALETRRQR